MLVNLLEKRAEKMDVHLAFLSVRKGTFPGDGRKAEEFYHRFIDALSVMFSRAFNDFLSEKGLGTLPYKGLCIAFLGKNKDLQNTRDHRVTAYLKYITKF